MSGDIVHGLNAAYIAGRDRIFIVMIGATRSSEVVSIVETATQKLSPALRKYTEKSCEKTETEAERGNRQPDGQIGRYSRHHTACSQKQLFGRTVAGCLHGVITNRRKSR